MREILEKYCSSLCICWWILGHFFHPWLVVPMPPLHLLLLPPTPPKQRAEARCSVRSVCHHVSPWWLRASSALAQSSLGFQAYKTGLWSCSHNQMLKGPFFADQWNHCRILEKNQNQNLKFCMLMMSHSQSGKTLNKKARYQCGHWASCCRAHSKRSHGAGGIAFAEHFSCPLSNVSGL